MRKLALIAITLFLLLLAPEIEYEAAGAQIPDSLPELDILSGQDAEWQEEEEPDVADEPPEPDIPYEDTVASITPDFIAQINEKLSQNSDTVGWLYIPDTQIDREILQNPPELADNQYYLSHDFERAPDKNGVFCMDYRAVTGYGYRDDLSRITALYGHSWDDNPEGELFAQIKKFRDIDFAREHPYIYFSTYGEDMVWEVFAVFDTTVELPYIVPDLSDREFYDMLDIVLDMSYYNYGIAVSGDDKLLVLSTCTFSVEGHEQLPEWNDYRFAVMAKLVAPRDIKKDEAVLAQNKDPLPPDSVLQRMEEGRAYSFPAYKQ